GVVERQGLLEVERDAPPRHVDSGEGALAVDPLDGSDGAVRHVQAPVALPELDPVAHGEAARLQALDLECAPSPRVNNTDEPSRLDLEPPQVPLLIDADHAGALPGLDSPARAHEAQHVAHAVARRPTFRFDREILPPRPRHLDALLLPSARLDE